LFSQIDEEDDDEDTEDWKEEYSEDSEADLEEVDYEQVLQCIGSAPNWWTGGPAN
jgi:hypothetical protein